MLENHMISNHVQTGSWVLASALSISLLTGKANRMMFFLEKAVLKAPELLTVRGAIKKYFV